MKKIQKIFLTLVAVAVALLLPVVSYAKETEKQGRYNPATEGIQSAYLTINREKGWLTGIAPGTTLEQINKFTIPGDLTADSKALGTGTLLTSASTGKKLRVVVAGDVNGDGGISVTDMLMLKGHILGTKLSGVAAAAGDVNADGSVSISDFVMLKSHLLGKETISTTNKKTQSFLLLAPKESQKWDVTAVAYASDNEALVRVNAKGVLTAGKQEGSTYIYALDKNGQVVKRQAVMVLKGGLQVRLEKAAYTVALKKSMTVKAVLNYPAETKLTWSTGDKSICSVSAKGVLTGRGYGSTTLRVTLPNGKYHEVPVQVTPPLKSMELEETLYKVKPKAHKELTLKLSPANSGEEFIWTSSDSTIATVTQKGVVTGIKYGTVTIKVKGKYSGLTASCKVKVCDVIQVAITFDDGPSSHTPKLLDYLKESGIKATFFVVGNRINSYKGTVKRIVNEGHELAYHSYSHKNHKKLSTEKIKSDFKKSNDLVKNLTGASFTLWRAPGGNINDRVLDAIDLPHIMWTVDTLDWKYRNVDHVYNAILKNADDGEIILLHDLHKTSVEGAIKAMKKMQAGNYEFLTVTELLSRNGKTPKNNTNYYKAPK